MLIALPRLSCFVLCAVGDNNGTIDGVCYFVSPAKRGVRSCLACLVWVSHMRMGVR